MKRNLMPMLALLVLMTCFYALGAERSYQEEEAISLAEFKKRTERKDKMVLVYFHARWCTICGKMKTVIEQVEAEYASRLEVLRIDTDRDKEVADEFEVHSLPLMVLYRNGNRQWVMVGLTDKAKLKEKIDTYQ